MAVHAVSSANRPVRELTEENLAAWVADLDPEQRAGELRIFCGSPAGEIVARRIVEAVPMDGRPPGPLHGMFTVEPHPGLGSQVWKVVAIY